MSVPYLNLEPGDGIAVMFKNQIFIPTLIGLPGIPMPVNTSQPGTIEGTFVEWICDSEGDPVGVVFTDIKDDTYCFPLATTEDSGGVYVMKLHDGALDEARKQRAEAQAAQARTEAERKKTSGERPAVVLAHSVPGRPDRP